MVSFLFAAGGQSVIASQMSCFDTACNLQGFASVLLLKIESARTRVIPFLGRYALHLRIRNTLLQALSPISSGVPHADWLKPTSLKPTFITSHPVKCDPDLDSE